MFRRFCLVPVLALLPAFTPPVQAAGLDQGPIEKISRAIWPGVPVIPRRSIGATEGRFTNDAGIPTYGVSGKSLMECRAFLASLVKAYS